MSTLESTLQLVCRDDNGQEIARQTVADEATAHKLMIARNRPARGGQTFFKWALETTSDPSQAPAVIRLPATTKERKRAYLRAAAGRPLVEWIWETLDREAAKISALIEGPKEKQT